MRAFEEIQADTRRATSNNDVEALLCYSAELDAIATPQSEALASRSRGWVHSKRGDYHSALAHFQRAVSIYEELGERRDVAALAVNIGSVHENTGNYSAALEHYHRALALHEEFGNRRGVAIVMGGIGVVYLNTGEHPSALSHFHRALALYEELGDRRGVAIVMGHIGNVHQSTGDYPASLEHQLRALALHEELGEGTLMADVMVNIGNVHMSTGDHAAALSQFKRALAIYEELGHRHGIARVTGNIGAVHGNTGNFSEALEQFNRALARHEEIGDRYGAALSMGSILQTYVLMGSDSDALALLQAMDAMQIDEPDTRIGREQNRATLQERSGDLDEAAATLHRALAEALEHSLRSKAADIHKSLRDLALKQNNLASYVEHNNEYTRITEEINGKESTTKLAMQVKQREIDAKDREHAQHMAVLHSTLPKHIADRVARGETVNDHFDNASVLFIDVVGFTTHSSDLDATIVVELLQNIFTSFDAICANHDVMKIKTIGDSYMAVAFGTANTEQRTANTEQRTANVMPSVVEAERIANVARAMMASVFTWPHTGERVMFRIGIHCGPVVAGVLGTERMQYDVWGDTVNVASRMENTSEPGKIHVSEALAKAFSAGSRLAVTLHERGTIDVKGKGSMQTYWLE